LWVLHESNSFAPQTARFASARTRRTIRTFIRAVMLRPHQAVQPDHAHPDKRGSRDARSPTPSAPPFSRGPEGVRVGPGRAGSPRVGSDDWPHRDCTLIAYKCQGVVRLAALGHDPSSPNPTRQLTHKLEIRPALLPTQRRILQRLERRRPHSHPEIGELA